jgi:hypothetical protein
MREQMKITHSFRERSESECDSSLAAKAVGGEAPPARVRAREKAASRAGDTVFAEFWAACPRKVGKRDAERGMGQSLGHR